jgi:hypothetical protein
VSINWPALKLSQCYDFRLLAVFEADPRNVTLNYESVDVAPRPVNAPHTAVGLEDGTFVTVQPFFQQDKQVALLLRITREEYFRGKTPLEPSAYPDVVRRSNGFMGKECIAKISADYFIPRTETPKPISVAFGPFKAGSAEFETVTGAANINGSPVQVVSWTLTPNASWKITLEAWQKGILSADTIIGAASDFDAFLLSFRDGGVAI